MKCVLLQLQNKAMIFGFTNDFVNRALTRVFFQKAGILQLELANKRVVPLQKAVSESIPQPYSAPESYKRAMTGVYASSPLLPPVVHSLDSVPDLASTRDLPASQMKMGRALEKKQNQSPSGNFSISNKLSLHITSPSTLQEVFYCTPFAVMTSSKIT